MLGSVFGSNWRSDFARELSRNSNGEPWRILQQRFERSAICIIPRREDSQKNIRHFYIPSSSKGRLMRTPLLALTLAALLSACTIPYETPEARANIERDLKLNADEIVTITETNWCLSAYGDLQVCKPKQGLGVLTKSKLVLALYKGGMYQQAEVINASDVQCAHLRSGRAAADIFYLFSDRWFAMLAPITPGGALALDKKAQFLNVLVPPNTESFTAEQGSFIRETDRKNYSAVAVPGTQAYVGTSQSIRESFNPCTQGKNRSAAP
jgi:hypothetical protein